jgi:hypothetical protein
MTRAIGLALLGTTLVVLTAVACSSAPGTDALRDSFAQQLSANKFVSDFHRSGDTMTFKAPRPDGTASTWEVRIQTATIEKQDDAKQPYKGTVTSSWSVNGREIKSSGSDSNLPLELTSTGLAQECWAFWEADAMRWSWE